MNKHILILAIKKFQISKQQKHYFKHYKSYFINKVF